MKKPTVLFSFQCVTRCTILLLALAFLSESPSTETVYKCVKDGKVNYTSDPDKNGQCEETAIRNEGPTPQELARLMEEKKQRQEQEQQSREMELREREVQAREMEAEAAAQRARTLENQTALPQEIPLPPSVAFPLTYPYWWGGGIMTPFPGPNLGGLGRRGIYPSNPIYRDPRLNQGPPPRPQPAPPLGLQKLN